MNIFGKFNYDEKERTFKIERTEYNIEIILQDISLQQAFQLVHDLTQVWSHLAIARHNANEQVKNYKKMFAAIVTLAEKNRSQP